MVHPARTDAPTGGPAGVPAPAEPNIVSATARLMGGTVGAYIRPSQAVEAVGQAQRDADKVLQRISRWADRLTRFSDRSELSRLNASRSGAPLVGPTLAAMLSWGGSAADLTGGIVDIALLDARLHAESDPDANVDTRGWVVPDPSAVDRSWTLRRGPRISAVVRRPGLRFDLDGVGKGWLADRAAAMLARHPAAVVDADGDIAISLHPGETWLIGIPHPFDPTADLGVLELAGLAPGGPQRFGVATSGTSIHRWPAAGGDRHHLIDPRTGHPAVTDVVQATVLAGSAAEAEAFAKSVVIVGSDDALRLLDRPVFGGAVLLTERGEILATPSLTRWLA